MKLLNYSEIDNGAKNNLLLGNGFSIGVSRSFSYRSLLSVGKDNGYLHHKVSQLFDELNTSDFEFILDQLMITANINRVIGLDFDMPTTYYSSVRDALIHCIRKIHPDFYSVESKWIKKVAAELSEFKRVFTTNYDLLLYWIVADGGFSKFTDFFWSSGLTFDEFNTDIWGNKTAILYLHGALFLYLDSFYIKKIKRTQDLLSSIEASLRGGNLPVFVSEGTSNEKLRSIARNSYLSFAFRQLKEVKTGITIFGHSLSPVDNHIVDAIIKNGSFQHIAYSIYVGDKSSDQIQNEVDNITHKLRTFTRGGGNLQFFDSSTSILSYSTQE